MEPVFRRLYNSTLLRRLTSKWIEKTTSRSERHRPESKTSEVWALAQNEVGSEMQAWLETSESYLFTAQAAVRSVEKLLSEYQMGA